MSSRYTLDLKFKNLKHVICNGDVTKQIPNYIYIFYSLVIRWGDFIADGPVPDKGAHLHIPKPSSDPNKRSNSCSVHFVTEGAGDGGKRI